MRRCCSQSSRRNFQWVARMEIGNYKLFWSNQDCFFFFAFLKRICSLRILLLLLNCTFSSNLAHAKLRRRFNSPLASESSLLSSNLISLNGKIGIFPKLFVALEKTRQLLTLQNRQTNFSVKSSCFKSFRHATW